MFKNINCITKMNNIKHNNWIIKNKRYQIISSFKIILSIFFISFDLFHNFENFRNMKLLNSHWMKKDI